MNINRPITAAARTNGWAGIVAAIGVAVQYFVGVPGFPKVPPGPIVLAVCGVLVLTVMPRFRWVILIGLLGPLFIAVGGIAEGSSWGRLADPAHFSFFVGTAVQWIGLVVAIVAGVIAVLQLRGQSGSARSSREMPTADTVRG